MNDSRKIIVKMCLAAFVPATLLSFAVAPLYLALVSDVAFAGGILCELVNHLVNVMDPIRYAACFAVMAYFAYRFPQASRLPLYLIFIGASVYEELANFLMDAIRGGLFDAAELLFVDAVYLGMDLLVLLAGGLILRYWNEKRKANVLAVEKASKYVEALPEGAPVVEETACGGRLNRKNPLQMTLLGTTIVITAFLILNGLIYDFAIGWPADFREWIDVIWFYFSLLIAGTLLYFGQLFLVRVMHRNART